MKTSVEISDPLFEEARRVAAERGVSLRALIEMGLRHVLAEQKSQKNSFQLRDARVGGQGLQPEFRSANWTEIRDAIYGDS